MGSHLILLDKGGHAYQFTRCGNAVGGPSYLSNQVQDVSNGLGQLTKEYLAQSGAVNTSMTPACRNPYRPACATDEQLVDSRVCSPFSMMMRAGKKVTGPARPSLPATQWTSQPTARYQDASLSATHW